MRGKLAARIADEHRPKDAGHSALSRVGGRAPLANKCHDTVLVDRGNYSGQVGRVNTVASKAAVSTFKLMPDLPGANPGWSIWQGEWELP